MTESNVTRRSRAVEELYRRNAELAVLVAGMDRLAASVGDEDVTAALRALEKRVLWLDRELRARR